MDSDFRNAHVDQSQHLLVLDKDTQQQASKGAIAMGSRIPAILEHDPDHTMDHAVSACARSVGWGREMYES